LLFVIALNFGRSRLGNAELRKSNASTRNQIKSRISENSVQPQEDEGKSHKALPTAWIAAPSQLNPDRYKIFNFSSHISDQKFGVTLDYAPRFLFPHKNHRLSHILTTLLISDICDEFLIRL